MSRKIKFRAWSDSNNAFIFRDLFDRNWYNERDLLVQIALPHDRQMYTVEQFTGLHDNNGVEIYEGDIIRVDDDWSEQTTHLVKWGGEYPAFEMYPGFDLESNDLMSALAGEGGMTVEVIGNIHENSDLLA